MFQKRRVCARYSPLSVPAERALEPPAKRHRAKGPDPPLVEEEGDDCVIDFQVGGGLLVFVSFVGGAFAVRGAIVVRGAVVGAVLVSWCCGGGVCVCVGGGFRLSMLGSRTPLGLWSSPR